MLSALSRRSLLLGCRGTQLQKRCFGAGPPAGKYTLTGLPAPRPHGKPEFQIIDPHPTEACSKQAGGNEGIPPEYIEPFIRQQTRRDPELGFATYGGLFQIIFVVLFWERTKTMWLWNHQSCVYNTPWPCYWYPFDPS